MFESMTVGEILKDLKSIKVPPRTRVLVDEARDRLQRAGAIPVEMERKLRKVCARYRVQMVELHQSRARARRTNGLMSMGMSREDAARLAEERHAIEEARRNDVGF